MAQRIKGQDVEVSIILNGADFSAPGRPVSITDVRNFEITPKFEKLEEQYLGETSKRYDEIFHGVDFKMDLHFENPGVLTLVDAIKARASSRGNLVTAAINIKAVLNFAGGIAKRVSLNNCFFEDMPINFGGRSEYGQFTLSGSCTDIVTI